MVAMNANFDRIARIYRWMEYASLGPLLERTREEFLPRLDACRRALVLGDGDGRFTAKLLGRNAAIRVHAVDRSAAMLGLLRRNCLRVGPSADRRLHTTCASAVKVAPSRKTDLVVTHFFLDCLTQSEAQGLIRQTAAPLAMGSLWLVSEFRVPHWPARVFVRGLYLAFRTLTGLRVTSLPDYAAPLQQSGFRMVEQRLRLFGVLTSELWQKSAAETFRDS